MSDATRSRFLWLIVSSAVVGLIACSSDSLWIDEAWMGLLASERSVFGWWHRMHEISGSTAQMPLYTFYLWLWDKLFGNSEWTLRAANIPLFVLGQWALVRSFAYKKTIGFWAAVISACNPLVWNYLAEARPYTMQYAGACLVVGALIHLATEEEFFTRDVALFCLGLILLSGGSALGIPWAGMACVTAFLFARKRQLHPKCYVPIAFIIGITSLLLAGILVYDFWTVLGGAKASSAVPINGTNLLFVVYELLGFAGLGPGRLQLRETPSIITFTPYILPLTALALALGATIFYLPRPERSVWRTLLLYSLPSLIFVVVLSAIAHFRLLGRHVIPLAPVLFVLLGYAAAAYSRWQLNRLFLILWMVSAVSLRFHPRHHRDDYRSAAAMARAALEHGERVWWVADIAGAEYYKVPLNAQNFTLSSKLDQDSLTTAPAPDLVCFSKRDIYDPRGKIDNYLREHDFKVTRVLPAFQILERKSAAGR
jgi:hypothetical protein